MAAPLASTVTFLFTDIEGSTRLWEQQPDAMREALASHDAALRRAIEAHGGRVFKTMGDSLCAAFPEAAPALSGAVDAQHALIAAEGMAGTLAVRMAVYTGEAEQRGGDYFGPALSRTARILAAANGRMILLSDSARAAADSGLPRGASLFDRGLHRLKDLSEPEHLFQLIVPGLAGPDAPLRTPSEVRRDLPEPGDDFVGREAEAAQLVELLQQSEIRLVTLTGPGGSGKTRLALNVAGRLAGRFANGVVWIELAHVRRPELVMQEAAAALELSGQAGLSPSDRLIAHLHEREILLVFDNFEQVVDAAGDLSAVLRACPAVHALVTSRERLNVGMEREFPVAPLSEPESVRLFESRARRASPAFRFSDSNAGEVAAICRRLEGLPLAVEIAAARVRGLSLEQILNRLEHRFDLLVGSRRDVTDRQRTMRGAVDWSYDLLAEDEREVFAAVAVFAGAFTLEAAEAICGAGVADSIWSLCDKSLLRLVYRDGEPRYWMLDTLREYGLEKLGETARLREMELRHTRYFLAYLRQVDPAVDQVAYLDHTAREIDNLRAGMDAAAHAGDDRLLADYGVAWRTYFHVRGLYREGIDRLGSAEEALRRLEDGSGLCAVLLIRGILLYHFDLDEACAKATECLDLAREAGDREMQMRALNLTGLVLVTRGRTDDGIALMEEALEHARKMENRPATASIAGNLGWSLLGRGESGRAIPLLREAVRLNRDIANQRDLALNLQRIGTALHESSPYEARGYLEESVEVARSVGDIWTAAHAEWTLAQIERAKGDRARANPLLAESIRALDDIGLKDAVIDHLAGLVKMAVQDQELGRAARLLGLYEAAIPFGRGEAQKAGLDPALAMGIRTSVRGTEKEAAMRSAAGLTWREIIERALAEL